MELGAKKFHEQRTAGPLFKKSAPAPPFAGFNVQFKEKMALTESRPLPDALLGGSSLTAFEFARCDSQLRGFWMNPPS